MLGSVNQSAMQAVSLAGQITFVLTLFYLGMSTGAGILTAQYWGKRALQTVLPLSYLCAFVLQLSPVYLYAVISLDEIIKLPFAYIRYRQYRWFNNITKDFAEAG